MSSLTMYSQSFSSLEDQDQKDLLAIWAAWGVDAKSIRVIQNIQDETALGVAALTELLRAFLAIWRATPAPGAAPRSAGDAWRVACYGHKLKGRPMPDGDCPKVLGRARGLDDYANAVASASPKGGRVTKGQAKRWLLKSADVPHESALMATWWNYMRATGLGGKVVWATFHSLDTTQDPFLHLPTTYGGILAVLGLGEFRDDDVILLAWEHAACGSPTLHRPTVADAGDYSYYRPLPDSGALWGLTEPLPGHMSALTPQPEVVMGEVSCRGLLLPFRIFRAYPV